MRTFGTALLVENDDSDVLFWALPEGGFERSLDTPAVDVAPVMQAPVIASVPSAAPSVVALPATRASS